MSQFKRIGFVITFILTSLTVVKAGEWIPFSQTLKFEREKASSLYAPTASLEVGEGVMNKDLDITMSSIEASSLPKLDRGIINVTDSFTGYRFLPHGEHFSGVGAKVVLGYDRTKIPSGYTEDDIKTYYYDESIGKWKALQRDSVDKIRRQVISHTTHFTDMINGIIQVPESPETQGFAPTTMSDLQAADPAAKVQLIDAPQVNCNGSASLQYSLEMPPARNGMTPNITIQYSSDAGSGWLGEGWNILTSSICVDTRWGVPRYKQNIETETYLLDGQMLIEEGVGLAHRNLGKARKSGRVAFYLRKEGAFSKIERIGDNPSNYIWEVTDRKNTKYIYGSFKKTKSAGEMDSVMVGVLKGDYQNSGREVVSEWRLIRIEEKHGDYIEYTYKDSVEGFAARSLYLDSIKAGNSGEAPHTIVVFRNGKEKNIKRSDARYGYLTSDSRLLERVDVYFEGEYLRGYKFSYETGSFSSDLLSSIVHLDSKGKEFSRHKLEYNQLEGDLYSTEKMGYTANAQESKVGEIFEAIADGYGSKLSMISGTGSNDGFSIGGGANAGISVFYAGVSYNFSHSTGRGEVTLTDINGDGLPDKVVQANGGIKYQLFDWKKRDFSEKVGRADFSGLMASSKSNSHSLSEDIGAGWSVASVGATFSETWENSETTSYTYDFNNDGLIDFASDGKVYFNRLEDGKPKFLSYSLGTDNQLGDFTQEMIPSSPGFNANVDLDKIKDSLESQYPLHDVVRVWRAPFDGDVKIEAPISMGAYIGPADSVEFADGVVFFLQHEDRRVLMDSVMPSDSKAINDSFHVNRGDRLFFRIQSRRHGWMDMVQWSPKIRYTSLLPLEEDEYGNSYRIYDAELDFRPGEASSIVIPQGYSFHISGDCDKRDVTSSDIRLKIVGYAKGDTTILATFPFDKDAIEKRECMYSSEELADTITLKFLIESDIPYNRDFLDWQPMVIVSKQGEDRNDTVYMSPHMDQWNNWVSVLPYEVVNIDIENNIEYVNDTVQIKWNSSDAKGGDDLRMFLYEKGQSPLEIFNGSTLLYQDLNGKDCRFIAYSDSVESSGMAIELHRKYYRISLDSYGQEIRTEVDTIIGTYSTSLYANYSLEQQRMGSFYRGWGQFAYNGGRETEHQDIALEDLKVNSLQLDEEMFKNLENNENGDEVSEELKNVFGNANETKFSPMSYDVRGKKYIGGTQYATLNGTSVSSSRLGNPIINPKDELPTYNFQVENTGKGVCVPPTLSSKTFTFSVSASGGAKIKKFGLGVSGGYSKAKSHTVNSIMDLNGDGYPDWLYSESKWTDDEGADNLRVNYTGMDGTLCEEKNLSDVGSPVQIAEAKCVGLDLKFNITDAEKGGSSSGGTQSAQTTKSKSRLRQNLEQMAEEAATTSQPLSVGASGNFSNNQSSSVWEWYDINGDGLPDKVTKDAVRLNLGYSFTDDLPITVEAVYESETYNGGAGRGISVPLSGSGNVSVGKNATFSQTSISDQLMDVNGDGLPDRIFEKDGSLYARINLGDRFDETEYLVSSNFSPNTIRSTAMSRYANGGAIFSVGMFTISPFVNGAYTKSVSRTLSCMSDFDGDGFPDLLESDDDESVAVRYSNVRATNKLRSVVNPFGGKYEIEYEHTQPTTDHPCGKWAMSKLSVSDSAGNPNIVSKFIYEDGKRDRYEREFLGFGKVYTLNVDGEDTIRTTLQEYDVEHYLTAGSSLRTLVAGKDTTEKYRDERTNYQYFAVIGQATLKESHPDSVQRILGVPHEKVITAYESNGNLDLSRETYKYGTEYGNLDAYKFEDLTNDDYGYTTDIKYSDACMGTPSLVEVKSIGGEKTYRKISAAYNDKNTPWAMTQMKQLVGNGEEAIVDIEYDVYGNITKKIMPKNSKGERMSYSYLYDRKYQMYPERVTDAFGYRSEMEDYDYRYGLPRIVRDINGYTIQYHIDDIGRIDTVISPNEQSDGIPYTISYEYNDKGTDYTNRYAITKHFDPQHPKDPIQTITHVDGLGRTYQVKKEAEIYGHGVKYIVSGNVKYDALGRTIETDHPSICENSKIGEIVDFNNRWQSRTSYDAIDRPTQQILPADNSSESVVKTNYTISDGRLKTTMISANGDSIHTYTNGAGQTVLTERIDPSSNKVVPIQYYFDPIGQLDSLIDAGGNVTRYTYDLAGRKLSISHPSTGLTSFKYDIAGNVLEKQTANLQGVSSVKYDYEYNRLTKISYPNHTENNVTYTYGGKNATHNRVGRLALVEDGSGATEFFYGRMGEVIKERRTMVIPNVAVATYTTQWKYDSHNRLLEMVYPDEEKIRYNYNLGGQLSSVVGEKKYLYRYVDTIGYDEYEQRKYIKYGNGTETNYNYTDNRRRLDNISVTLPGNKLAMDNHYEYDVMDNIVKLVNLGESQISIDGESIGGSITHDYHYDLWNRLTEAEGKFIGGKSKKADYKLKMGYDQLYNVTSKKLDLTQENLQFEGRLRTGYDYSYNYDPSNPFKLQSINMKSYSTDSATVDTLASVGIYDFDANGNMTMVASNSSNDTTCIKDTTGNKVRQLLWDEENRLLAINDNGYVSNYFYDSNGERTVKISSPNLSLYVNSKSALNGDTLPTRFVAYPSPYLVVKNGGEYTKHIYIGTQRIASKIGDFDAFGADPRRVEKAGADIKVIDYATIYSNANISARYDSFGISCPILANNDYVGGKSYCCSDGDAISDLQNNNSDGEFAKVENIIYFYHPDHLGSTSLITDAEGKLSRSISYIPYGEIFVEESDNKGVPPYRFNAKELDEETGLYYYGARYLDPTGTIWLSVDPLFEKYVGMNPYGYCAGNPVRLVDVDGRNPVFNEEGDLIGVTEDTGLQGDAFFMDNDSYNHKMGKAEAQEKDKGESFLNSEEAKNKYLETFSKLNQRPDWDGYLTLEEANEWYRQGSGEPLYVSLEKINLDGLFSLGEGYVGETYTFNLLYGASLKANDGLVYGSLTFKRYPNHTCRAYADTYDFDYKSWLDPRNWLRNIETFIGDLYAGDGMKYKIYIYGEKKLKPILPWLK